jgi:hypothetical protein
MMVEAAAPLACTQAEFARQQGWAKSYVTKLKGEDRLVFTPEGLVDVAQSIARIKASTGADARASTAVMGEHYADAKDRNEHYTAELARLKFEEQIGALRSTAEVAAVVADVITRLRGQLEAWPDRLAPELAALGGDEGRVRAALADHIHSALTELAHGFEVLATVRAA